jgi:hypothetical protein
MLFGSFTQSKLVIGHNVGDRAHVSAIPPGAQTQDLKGAGRRHSGNGNAPGATMAGTGPDLWTRLQAIYDTWHAERRLAKEIRRIPVLR